MSNPEYRAELRVTELWYRGDRDERLLKWFFVREGEDLTQTMAELVEIVRKNDVPLPESTELVRINEILRESGIEYPLGVSGVRDLANMADGRLEDLKRYSKMLDEITEECDKDLTDMALYARITRILSQREEGVGVYFP